MLKLKLILMILSLPIVAQANFMEGVQRMEKSGIPTFDVKLKKAEMEKNYLLNVAVISGPPAPTGSALANKIVNFVRKGSTIAMFESLDGKVATDSVATKILIATFPVIAENSEWVFFDFNQGMELIFSKRSMAAGSSKETALKVTDSFIGKTEQRGKYFLIEQYVRVDEEEGNSAMKLKYNFSTYKKRSDFPSVVSKGFTKNGFFEAHPILEAGTGKETRHIMKYDFSKPATYYMTKNVPAEHRQAVIDGVLYWNRVLGREVFKTADLPEGIDVHEPGYHIVQWLDWDTAGFAYANMNGDPLTGEVLEGHVYMTSSFGKGALKRAKRLYRQYLQGESSAPEQITLKNFDSAHTCYKTFDHAFARDMAAAIDLVEKSELSEEEQKKIFLRVANDYIREVVAHEVGHTIGLRHNFSASMQTNIEVKDYDKVVKEYLLTGHLDESLIPGGSVMDYTPFFNAAMIGAHIRLEREGLKYDRNVTAFGYGNRKFEEIDWDAFCTDGDRATNKYVDCRIWDRHENPFEAAHYELKNFFGTHGFRILNSFYNDKGEIDDKSIEKASLDPVKDAESVFKDDLEILVRTTLAETNLISVRNSFPFPMTSLDQIDYKKALGKLKKEEIETLGGLSTYLLGLFKIDENGTPAFMKMIMKDFELQLQKMAKDLSEQQVATIKAKTARYFPIFEKELLLQLLGQLKSKETVGADSTFVTEMVAFVDEMFVAKTDDVLFSMEGMEINQARFDYVSLKDKNLRAELVKLLNVKFSERPSVLRKHKKARKAFNEKIKEELKKLTEIVSEDDMSDELFDWYSQESSLIKPLALPLR